MKRRNYFLAAGFVAFISACNNLNDAAPKSNNTGLLEPENEQLVQQGQILYASTCASCHGADLGGQKNWKTRDENGLLPAPPHDESGHTWHHTDQILFDITKYGVQKYAGADYESDMPAYDGDLTDEEIIAVLSYIKSTWPKNVRARHDGVNRQHEAIRKQQEGK